MRRFGAILFLWIWMDTVAGTTAPIPPNYKLTGEILTEDYHFYGNLLISFDATLQKGDTVWIRHWGNAYQKGSALYKELIENQNTALHFSDNKGAFHLDSLLVNGKKVTPQSHSKDWSFFILQAPLENKKNTISLSFRQELPDIQFNGVGILKENNHLFFQLSHLWPEIHHPVLSNHQKNVFAENNTQLFAPPTKKTWEVAIQFPKKLTCTCNLPKFELTDGPMQLLSGISQTSFNQSFALICGTGYYEIIDKLPGDDGYFQLGLESNFPPPFSVNASVLKVKEFIEKTTGMPQPDTIRIALFPNGQVIPPSTQLITMAYKHNPIDFEIALVQQWLKGLLTQHYQIDPYTETWFYTGLTEYLKQAYTQQNYPDKKFLGPYANFWFARFLALDQYNSSYEQQLYFLYMSRLSLDQPVSDPFINHPKGNFLAVLEGKAALNFSYLQSFISPKTFSRGLRKWFESNQGKPFEIENFLAAMQYFSNKDVNWWQKDLLHTNKRLDYAIAAVHKCSYTLGVTVKNKGDLETPFSITGVRDGEAIITIWYDGFKGEKLLQFHLDDFDALYIDYENKTPEWNNQDNYTRTTGVLPQLQPFKFQFFGGLENREKTQLFWSPIGDFNAYDGALIGLNVFNTSLVRKKVEYSISPVFSSRTGRLTGSASFVYNITPRSGWFHHIYFGAFGRYYHYAEDLAFTRLSPTVGFHFRKPRPRDENIHKLKLRWVTVARELPGQYDGERDNAFDLNRASYDVLDVRYWWENVNILHPFMFRFDYQVASNFSRMSVEYDQRWMLPNKKWLIWRTFAGSFLKNNAQGTSFYDFGLSGTRDYLFDYSLLGRSDLSGIWSQQFFVSDGGFKSRSDIFSGNWMLTSTLAVPIWKYVGVYGDVGWTGSAKLTYWGYGVRVSILSDFLEFYFPIQDFSTNYLHQEGYFRSARFVLNLNYEQIVQRLRRGYY